MQQESLALSIGGVSICRTASPCPSGTKPLPRGGLRGSPDTGQRAPSHVPPRRCARWHIELPRAFADSAGVHCKRCGHQLGTWGAFKEQTKELILTELAARGQKPEGARSSDPLPGLNSA